MNKDNKVTYDRTLHALMASVNTPYLKHDVKDFTAPNSVQWAVSSLFYHTMKGETDADAAAQLARELLADRHTFVALLQGGKGSVPAHIAQFHNMTREELKKTYDALTDDPPKQAGASRAGKGKAKDTAKAQKDITDYDEKHANALAAYLKSPAGLRFPSFDVEGHLRLIARNLRKVTLACALKDPDQLNDIPSLDLSTIGVRALIITTASTAEKNSMKPPAAAAAPKKGNKKAVMAAAASGGFAADVSDEHGKEGVGAVSAANLPKVAGRVMLPMVMWMLNEVASNQLLYADPASGWWCKPIRLFREKYQKMMMTFLERHGRFEWWDISQPDAAWDSHPIPEWYAQGESGPMQKAKADKHIKVLQAVTKQTLGPGHAWNTGGGEQNTAQGENSAARSKLSAPLAAAGAAKGALAAAAAEPSATAQSVVTDLGLKKKKRATPLAQMPSYGPEAEQALMKVLQQFLKLRLLVHPDAQGVKKRRTKADSGVPYIDHAAKVALSQLWNVRTRCMSCSVIARSHHDRSVNS